MWQQVEGNNGILIPRNHKTNRLFNPVSRTQQDVARQGRTRRPRILTSTSSGTCFGVTSSSCIMYEMEEANCLGQYVCKLNAPIWNNMGSWFLFWFWSTKTQYLLIKNQQDQIHMLKWRHFNVRSCYSINFCIAKTHMYIYICAHGILEI